MNKRNLLWTSLILNVCLVVCGGVILFKEQSRIQAAIQKDRFNNSPNRRAFLVMKETIRRSLVSPSLSTFLSDYKEIGKDFSDENEVAESYHVDYWKASGLVDCTPKIGNLQRKEWEVIMEKTSGEIVFVRFGDETILGTRPLGSFMEQLNHSEGVINGLKTTLGNKEKTIREKDTVISTIRSYNQTLIEKLEKTKESAKELEDKMVRREDTKKTVQEFREKVAAERANK